MDWQDQITILSFAIGIISLIVGVISLIVGWISMRRTGTIQKALQEQSEQIYKQQKVQELLPQIKKLSQDVTAHHDDPNQLHQDLISAVTCLSELNASIKAVKEPVDKLLEMISKNYNLRLRQEPVLYTALDFSKRLGEIIVILERECV